jgi:hypothetical protein
MSYVHQTWSTSPSSPSGASTMWQTVRSATRCEGDCVQQDHPPAHAHGTNRWAATQHPCPSPACAACTRVSAPCLCALTAHAPLQRTPAGQACTMAVRRSCPGTTAVHPTCPGTMAVRRSCPGTTAARHSCPCTTAEVGAPVQHDNPPAHARGTNRWAATLHPCPSPACAASTRVRVARRAVRRPLEGVQAS